MASDTYPKRQEGKTMFRITRRRSLVTLTVLAGLLGAAAPAVAAPAPFLVDGPFSAQAHSGARWGETQAGRHSVTAPTGTSFVVDGPLIVEPTRVARSGIVTDNKDPDKRSADHANNLSGALVAADFYYKEATG